MGELSDEERIGLGARRFLALRERIGERRAGMMLTEIADRLELRGFSPDTRTVMRVAGNVTQEEWDLACSRIPAEPTGAN